MSRAPPPRDDVPDLDECLRLGINPNASGAPTYGDRRKRERMTQIVEEVPTQATSGYRMIAIATLAESKTNPRKTWGDLDELAESVRQVGILQPVVATKNTGDGEGYTLVFGHRRLRAAKRAGLTELPVIVRAMTERQVLEAQVVENCARNDIHPFEEAEGYERLHAKHGLSVDEIAAKVGKSRAAVYARMKLCALCPEGRTAFYEERLTPSTALFLARIPHHTLQREALKRITAKGYDGELPSAREAFRIISGKYMLRLADAPFATADAQLVPKAGSCSTCPKRTGNQPELFSDVKSADVCTDPTCWETKRLAGCAAKASALEAKGATVLAGIARTRAFGAPELEPPAGYVKASDHSYEHRGALGDVYKRACKDKGVEPKRVVMFDEKGKPVELVSKASLPKPQFNAAGGRQNYTERWNSREKVRKAREQAHTRVGALLLAALKNKPPSADEAFRMLSYDFDVYRPVDKKARSALQKLKGRALIAALLALRASCTYRFEVPARDGEDLASKLFAHYAIDTRAIELEEVAKVAPRAKASHKLAKVAPKAKTSGKAAKPVTRRAKK
jgi:ParB/RepB/Spo0J family partition protein